MSALGVLALLMLNSPNLALGAAAVAGGILIMWAARRVQGNGAHLLCALLLIEELSGASFLPLTNDQLYLVRYPLLIAFCGAAVWTAFQNSEILQGGFLDYLIYLGTGRHQHLLFTIAKLFDRQDIGRNSDVHGNSQNCACSS